MPAECQSSFISDYLCTLGVIEGFVDTQQCDVNLLVGDFNVDFSRGGMLSNLLVDFMSEFNLVACDLCFHNDTYERDDGLAHTWIDHLIISQSYTHLVSDVYTDCSGHVLSHHFPIFFLFHVHCSTFPALPSSSPVRPAQVDWSKASSPSDHCDLVYQNLPALPAEICDCTYVNCARHHRDLDV